MKKAFFIALLALSGCGNRTDAYQPKLLVPAASESQYKNDRAACGIEVRQRMEKSQGPKDALLGGFGLAGGLVNMATSDSDDDGMKSPITMVDECMTKRGYKIAN